MSARPDTSGLPPELLGSMRKRHLAANLDRVTTLDRAAEARTAGTLDEALHTAALRDAHKLAGTLGTLGLGEGTDLARLAESMLEAGSPDAEALAGLARRIRAILEGEDGKTAAPEPAESSAGICTGPFETLAMLWRPERVANLARLDVIEHAVVALLRGDLDDMERAQARAQAGELVRSLSRFGYADCSHRAAQVESLVADPGSDQWTISKLLLELRAELESAGMGRDHDGCAAPLPQSRQDPEAPTSGRRVLLVSGDPELGRGLTVAGVRTGLDLAVLAEPEAARAELAARRYDACIVDLAKLDRAAIHELEKLVGAASPTPVLALSPTETFDDRLAVAHSGARYFLLRELASGQLADAVARVIQPATTTESCVLAVDDDPVVLDALAEFLEAPGLALVRLPDPLQLWSMLEARHPDLLILDVDMPGVDGLQLTRVVRADPSYWQLPVLLLTARSDPESIRTAFALGVDDYVVKPIVGPELRARIAAHLERTRLQRAFAEVDPLTRVATRGKAQQAIRNLLRLAGRREEPLAFAVLDVDRFKQVNDRHGHVAGDMVLRRFGELLRQAFRAEDAISRWSGDEFVVAMYGARLADAVERVAGFIELVRLERFPTADGDSFAISCSAGVAEFPADGNEVESLFVAADGALFEAKERRDRVVPTRRPAAIDEADTVPSPDQVDVLLVEDDETITELVVFALETRGYRVAHLDNGADAAAALAGGRLRARVVLLDVGLPGLDGFAVLRRLRDRRLLDGMRVIVLTARSSEAEVLRALRLGAVDHVAKPFSLPVLVQRVQTALATA